MAEGGRVGELPHEIIGDQRLPLRGVLDEGLEMAAQELGGDRIEVSSFNLRLRSDLKTDLADMCRYICNTVLNGFH